MQKHESIADYRESTQISKENREIEQDRERLLKSLGGATLQS